MSSKEPTASENCSARFTADKSSKMSLIIDFTNHSYPQRSSRSSESQFTANKRVSLQQSYSPTNAQRKPVQTGKKANNDNSTKPCYCSDCVQPDAIQKKLMQELEDQLLKLMMELIKEKNQNQLSRREINIAKKVVEREVGDNIISFETLLQMTNDENWMGRQQMIFVLKRRIRDLTALVESMEGENSTPPPRRRTGKQKPLEEIPDERTIYWTLELERREVFRNAERDKKDLAASKVLMKENLESLLKKNQELMKDVRDLRGKISSVPKTIGKEMTKRLRELTYQLKTHFDGKVEDRRNLDEIQQQICRNCKMAVELRAKISLEKQIAKDREAKVSLLKTNESNLLAMSEELTKDKNKAAITMKKKLADMERNYRKICFHVDKTTALISDSKRAVEEIRESQTKCSASDLTNFWQGHDPSKTNKSIISVKGTPNDMSDIGSGSNLVVQLSNNYNNKYHYSELERYRSVLRELETKKFEKSERVYDIISKTKEIALTFMRDRYVLWKLTLDIDILKNRLKKYRKVVSRPSSKLKLVKTKNYCQQLLDTLDERRTYLSILKIENKFIKTLIRRIFESEADDFELLEIFLGTHTEVFSNSLKNCEA